MSCKNEFIFCKLHIFFNDVVRILENEGFEIDFLNEDRFYEIVTVKLYIK